MGCGGKKSSSQSSSVVNTTTTTAIDRRLDAGGGNVATEGSTLIVSQDAPEVLLAIADLVDGMSKSGNELLTNVSGDISNLYGDFSDGAFDFFINADGEITERSMQAFDSAENLASGAFTAAKDLVATATFQDTQSEKTNQRLLIGFIALVALGGMFFVNQK